MRFFLEDASTVAREIDTLFYTLLLLCLIVAFAVTLLILWFSIRYRRRSHADRSGAAAQNLKLELGWTLIPFALFLVVFLWAAKLYFELQTPPDEGLAISVVGKQWMWKVQHPGGQREINTLHVPLGIPVTLSMISQDVIHSFYVPAFRIKQDVLPGRYTRLWFEATLAGEYPLYCAEFCGTGHARMTGRIVVMEPADYQRWLENRSDGEGLAEAGAQLFRSLGCSGCHGEHAAVHAPKLAGLYGRPVPLSDGRVVTADERYLRDAVLLPAQEIAAGYEPIMPSFEGQIEEDEVLKLIAYFKSLAAERKSSP